MVTFRRFLSFKTELRVSRFTGTVKRPAEFLVNNDSYCPRKKHSHFRPGSYAFFRRHSVMKYVSWSSIAAGMTMATVTI